MKFSSISADKVLKSRCGKSSFPEHKGESVIGGVREKFRQEILFISTSAAQLLFLLVGN